MKFLTVSRFLILTVGMLSFLLKWLMFLLIFVVFIMLIKNFKFSQENSFKKSNAKDKNLFFDKQLTKKENIKEDYEISKEVTAVIASAVGYVYSSNNKRYKVHSIKRIFYADNRLD